MIDIMFKQVYINQNEYTCVRSARDTINCYFFKLLLILFRD